MYSIVRTIGLPVQVMSGWEPINTSSVLVSEIFQKYRQVIAVVVKTAENLTLNIDITPLKASYGSFGGTLELLFEHLGDFPYTFIESLPQENVGYVRCVNAYAAGYTTKLAARGYDYSNYQGVEFKPDIQMFRKKEQTDLSMLHKYCLLSVNGYYHMTDSDGTNTWIVDGGKSCYYANNNQVGITSFYDVGELKKYRITDEDILIPEGFTTLKDRIALKLPEAVTDKVCFLVLGGYLVFPSNGVLWQTSDQEMTMDLKKICYIERILESRNYINLDSMELTPVDTNATTINIEEAWSDAKIRKYFQLSQSFWVVVDTDNIFTAKIPLRHMRAPGIFTSYQEPHYPIILGTGRTAEYWKTKEDKRWSITLTDSYRRRYMHHREKETSLKNVADQLDFETPHYFSQGFLLEIGAYRNKEI